MSEQDELLLTPKEIEDTLFDLKVRENCLGRRVTPPKKYDALLYAQLAKVKQHDESLIREAYNRGYHCGKGDRKDG